MCIYICVYICAGTSYCQKLPFLILRSQNTFLAENSKGDFVKENITASDKKKRQVTRVIYSRMQVECNKLPGHNSLKNKINTSNNPKKREEHKKWCGQPYSSLYWNIISSTLLRLGGLIHDNPSPEK